MRRVRWARAALLGSLSTATVFYALIVIHHFSTPEPKVIAKGNWLDCCRDIVLRYGLVPTGHVANDAKAYLEAQKADAQVQETLSQVDGDFVPVPSQQHPLLGQTAPAFLLNDDRGEPHELSQFTVTGPVVLVFYYGYHCSHCVAQLFALQEDLDKFLARGATVVALSGDDSEQTAERFSEYGRINFPVLSDQNNIIAEKYGVYRPETSDHPEDLKHGTFLIAQDGTVIWSYLGTKPFIDNRSLLSLLESDRPEIPKRPAIESGVAAGVVKPDDTFVR